MEVLTTLLVILTVIQPFICLHPVIIWSQDSNQNSTFLLLIIFIWFLPICVHVLVKAVISPGIQKCKTVIVEKDTSQVDSSEHIELKTKQKTQDYVVCPQTGKMYTKARLPIHSEANGRTLTETDKQTTNNCSKRSAKIIKVLDLLAQIMQLLFFLVTFSLATNHIVNLEFSVSEGRKERRENLQDFVLPAIISVFLWMVSISFLLLALGKISKCISIWYRYFHGIIVQ